MELEILHQTDRLVVVNKPAGLLVHRTSLERSASLFMLQILRNQIGQRVYPIHRLDKPTSGVIFFALDPDHAREMSLLFGTDQFTKRYLAVLRGYCPEEGVIDHPLVPDQGGEAREAVTRFRRLAVAELPYPVGIFNTARYSLVEAEPVTGRRHQIRRHFKHIRYPILGDTRFGDRHHNRFLGQTLETPLMMLHSWRTEWINPQTGEKSVISAELPAKWERMTSLCNWEPVIRSLYLK